MILFCGDSINVLKIINAGTMDALVTDPPAGISFMGKDWDKRDDFVQRMTEIYRECLRVLKPGAHGLVWAIPRTSHWTATALEQAGFEIRDVVTHVFGSGFPKSLDVSKAIDKAAGAEREVLKRHTQSKLNPNIHNGSSAGLYEGSLLNAWNITAPATDAAKQWQGWGTALKPASEHWILVRKPLGEKTVAKNVMRYGTGAINVNASRIGNADSWNSDPNIRRNYKNHEHHKGVYGGNSLLESKTEYNENRYAQGRFPANFVLSHNEDCDEQCTAGCAVAELDRQSLAGGMHSAGKARQSKRECDKSGMFALPGDGHRIGDTGGASRFFYCAKASKRDRNEGLEGMPAKEAADFDSRPSGDFAKRMNRDRPPVLKQNTHPTVKSTKLMEYLIRLITPPGGIVLDPFMGSGSTGVAANRLGFGFIGIERLAEYYEIALRRIDA